MKRMKIWVGLSSHYNASLPGYSYLSLFSISFLFCMGIWLPDSYGYELGLECLLAVPGIAELALAAWDTALTIITTSLEMLHIKPFGSKRCHFLILFAIYIFLNSCSELYLVGTCRRHFIIQAHAHWIS